MAQVTYQIANLLEKMTSADKDVRFMATIDLLSELQKDDCKLDDDSERKVVKMLLKLLEDKSGELLRGELLHLAVKCIGCLVNKVKEYQVETVVDTLCANLISGSDLLRDVSSLVLKSIICCALPPASSVLASGVCKRITPKLTQAIVKSDDMTVRVESLDILSDLLLRFGGMLVSFQPSIEEALLPQLSSPHLAVRKRAITAIGHLVVTCANPIFERIMQFLLEELKRKSNISTTRTYVCCVVAVSKAAERRFCDYLHEVMALLVEFCNKEDDDELCEFCIQALESFILRFPKEIGPQDALLPQLSSPRLAVRNRAITAIGHLAFMCPNPIFERIMQILLEELKRKSNISTTRTYVCCVVAVSKAAGYRFGDYVPEVMDLLVEFCNIEDDDELRDFCIQAFKSFILGCPKEIGPQVDTIVKLCSKFLCHDPNYHYDDDAEVMDVNGNNGDYEGDSSDDANDDEDEGQEYSDDEDMSWKVRRAAAKCLEAVILSRREKLVSLYATVSPLLISRFKEREENVKLAIMNAYLSLMKQTKAATPHALLLAASQTKEVVNNGSTDAVIGENKAVQDSSTPINWNEPQHVVVSSSKLAVVTRDDDKAQSAKVAPLSISESLARTGSDFGLRVVTPTDAKPPRSLKPSPKSKPAPPVPEKTLKKKVVVELEFVPSNGDPEEVRVTGSFNNWQTGVKLQNKVIGYGEKALFFGELELPLGKHEVMFVVDGDWVLSDKLPKCKATAEGHEYENNILEVV